MNTCTACKNKTSNDRCTSISITGLAFCGIHARSKSPRIWSVVNDIDKKVTLISKVWRGYRIRRLLKLAGPGVLRRSMCHNDEELVLLEDKTRVHPLDYFAFQENDKIWWFDIRSMIGCLNSKLIPTNPYTRQRLSMDTRYRLRALYKYRIHNRLPTLHETRKGRSLQDLTEYQWMRVCQILHENGFEDYTPNTFLSMPPISLYYFMLILRMQLYDIPAAQLKTSRYQRFIRILKRELELFRTTNTPHLQTATALMILLNDMDDAFNVCSAIVQSLGRL